MTSYARDVIQRAVGQRVVCVGIVDYANFGQEYTVKLVDTYSQEFILTLADCESEHWWFHSIQFAPIVEGADFTNILQPTYGERKTTWEEFFK